MADALRADPETVQRMLQRSQSLWSSYAVETLSPQLPTQCAQLRNILDRAPAFPACSVQANTTSSTLRYHHRGFGLEVSGTSTWRTSLGECNLPAKVLRQGILYGVHKSMGCDFAEHSCFANWPGVQEHDDKPVEGNHLAILIMAWAYILSARWVELQLPDSPKATGSLSPSSMRYNALKAGGLNDEEDLYSGAIEVDIGDTSEQGARWWAAILAPGEGWQATLTVQDKVYLSPWSAHIMSPQRLNVWRKSVLGTTGIQGLCQQFNLAPTSEQALDHLLKYCEYHNITSQCIPALAASLFLPWKNGAGGSVFLPLPRSSGSPDNERKSSPGSLQRTLLVESRLLPYYMTLSCNTRGLRALLEGSFFDPAVPCNLVSPWMQPVLQIINPTFARGDFTSLARIMGKRDPTLAALWLGALLLRMEETVIQDLRNGFITVELNAAAWTGTVHSFINAPTPSPFSTENDEISRADECRLIFLTGSDKHPRAPITPWPPLGTTPLCFTDIEIRQHVSCTGHCLRYVGWRWDTEDGPSQEDPGLAELAVDRSRGATTTFETGTTLAVPQTMKVVESERLSEGATRSIFRWLRVDGYPPTEKEIYTHEWIDLDFSSEDSLVSADSSAGVKEGIVNEWLSKVDEAEVDEARLDEAEV